MTPYFIIEHPTRGILSEESEYQAPRFLREAMRSDDRAMRFFHIVRAREAMTRYLAVRHSDAYILRSPDKDRDEIEWVKVT